MSPSSVDEQERLSSEKDPFDPEVTRAPRDFDVLDELGESFEVVEASDPLDRVRVRLRTDRAQQLRCVYCHETLARSAVEKCSACNTYLHRECGALLEACPTLGCTGKGARTEAISQPKKESRLRRVGDWAAGLLIGLAFAVVAGFVTRVGLAVVCRIAETSLGLALSDRFWVRVLQALLTMGVGVLVFNYKLRGRLRESD